jgi:hypothetical protein
MFPDKFRDTDTYGRFSDRDNDSTYVDQYEAIRLICGKPGPLFSADGAAGTTGRASGNRSSQEDRQSKHVRLAYVWIWRCERQPE